MQGEIMSTTLDVRRPDLLDRFTDWLDAPEFLRFLERPRAELFRNAHLFRLDEMIKVEEKMGDGALTVRAELPGIDPDRDVDISVADGRLTIAAERKEETPADEKGYSEFRYGSFRRTMTLPDNAKADEVKAEYRDGILTITVPVAPVVAAEPKKVAIARA
jgi:HSP20 family protein